MGQGFVTLQDPSDNTRVGEFDGLFKVPVFIDEVHHEIHEKCNYNLSLYDEDAAIGHVIQIYLKTPAISSPQKRMHLTHWFEVTGEAHIRAYSNISYVSGGSNLVSPFNHFRGGPASAVQAVRYGSDKLGNKVVYDSGSAVPEYDRIVGAGQFNGATFAQRNEYVLEPNTEYIYYVTSLAAGINIAAGLDWYEHADE